uniref:Uncharacterized protein n=1 Tax=Micrurus corallinus TaxID=54390 RepID=A0A2D4G502_MICCO
MTQYDPALCTYEIQCYTHLFLRQWGSKAAEASSTVVRPPRGKFELGRGAKLPTSNSNAAILPTAIQIKRTYVKGTNQGSPIRQTRGSPNLAILRLVDFNS